MMVSPRNRLAGREDSDEQLVCRNRGKPLQAGRGSATQFAVAVPAIAVAGNSDGAAADGNGAGGGSGPGHKGTAAHQPGGDRDRQDPGGLVGRIGGGSGVPPGAWGHGPGESSAGSGRRPGGARPCLLYTSPSPR